MSIFNDASFALCHEDIEKKLTGKVDRVTIYRILNGFCENGKLHKIISDNGKTYFAPCHCCSEHEHNDNHLHFRCLDCGEITCMDKPVEVPTLPDGFTFSSLLFTVSGRCPYCLKSENEKIAR